MTVQRDRRRLAAGNIRKAHQLEPIHPTLDMALSCLSYLTFTCLHHRHKEQKKECVCEPYANDGPCPSLSLLGAQGLCEIISIILLTNTHGYS